MPVNDLPSIFQDDKDFIVGDEEGEVLLIYELIIVFSLSDMPLKLGIDF